VTPILHEIGEIVTCFTSFIIQISKQFGSPLCKACLHLVGDEQLARLYPRFFGHQSHGW
jgi:hypothetical protein